MSFSSLQDMMGKKKLQHDEVYREATDVFSLFRRVANEVLPENIHDLYTIGHLNEGTLYIEVENGASAQIITLHKHVILRKMAMSQKKILVSDIRITQKRKQA